MLYFLIGESLDGYEYEEEVEFNSFDEVYEYVFKVIEEFDGGHIKIYDGTTGEYLTWVAA